LKKLDKKFVLKPSENYRGLSYSDLIIRWQRWLFSDNPDQNFVDSDILFLRGNIGYHQSNLDYLHSYVEIDEGTSILVPIITTHHNIGDHHKRIRIKNEFLLRKVIKEHVDAAGPFWATLEAMKSKMTYKIVTNLESHRVESMLFELTISEENPFLDKMDEPNVPGTFMAMVAGYFVLLYCLPPSSYRLRFGGNGMDGFYTESLYEIKIISKKKSQKDLSGQMFTPAHLLKEKKRAIQIPRKSSK
jgi:hypothetical protein